MPRIRNEQPGDGAAIHAVVCRAFGRAPLVFTAKAQRREDCAEETGKNKKNDSGMDGRVINP